MDSVRKTNSLKYEHRSVSITEFKLVKSWLQYVCETFCEFYSIGPPSGNLFKKHIEDQMGKSSVFKKRKRKENLPHIISIPLIC